MTDKTIKAPTATAADYTISATEAVATASVTGAGSCAKPVNWANVGTQAVTAWVQVSIVGATGIPSLVKGTNYASTWNFVPGLSEVYPGIGITLWFWTYNANAQSIANLTFTHASLASRSYRYSWSSAVNVDPTDPFDYSAPKLESGDNWSQTKGTVIPDYAGRKGDVWLQLIGVGESGVVDPNKDVTFTLTPALSSGPQLNTTFLVAAIDNGTSGAISSFVRYTNATFISALADPTKLGSEAEYTIIPPGETSKDSDGTGYMFFEARAVRVRSKNKTPVVSGAGVTRATVGVESSITATVTVEADDVMTYLWEQVGGPDSVSIADATTTTMKVTPTSAGTYAFKLTATDDTGDSGEAFFYVTTPAARVVPVAQAANPGAWTVEGNAETSVIAVGDLDDTTFMRTPDGPDGDSITFALGTLGPGAITVTTRGARTAEAGISRTVEVLQGDAVVIASQTFALTTAFQDYPLKLTTEQMAMVTDRKDLRVRITDTQTS